MNNNIINLNPLGSDSVNGGVFFGSGMTPNGVFKNVPRYDFTPEMEEKDATLVLTLTKAKYSLNENLKSEYGIEVNTDNEFETFISNYIDLLIDYRDLRNFIFFGSANTEMAYQINNLINVYPYKTLVSEIYTETNISVNNRIVDGKNYTDIIFPYYNDNNRSDLRMIVDNWNKFILNDQSDEINYKDYQILDRNNDAFNILNVIAPYQNKSETYTIVNVENVNVVTSGYPHSSIKITTLEDLNINDANLSISNLFVNNELNNNLSVIINNKAYMFNQTEFSVLRILSNNEFLIVRKDTSNLLEDLSLNISGTNTFGGLVIFGLDNSTIFNIKQLENYTYNFRNLISFKLFGGVFNGVSYDSPSTYKINDVISFFDFNNNTTPLDIRYEVQNNLGENFDYNLNSSEETFRIIDIIHTPNLANRALDEYRFVLEREYKTYELEEINIIDPSIITSLFNGKTRYSNISRNGIRNWFKITLDGYLPYENLMTYIQDQVEMRGFIITPNSEILSDFELNLTPEQKYLLSPSPINPVPWPRRDITNNIMNILDPNFNPNSADQSIEFEMMFYDWLNNPNLFYQRELTDFEDDDAYINNLYYEYQLVRTIVSDETYTNQLIRRAFPNELLTEIYDSEQYFSRFVTTAGWFFDQIKLYIDFLKYTHTINYGEFNQLSPQFYKQYAEHYGFNLFEDEDTDFTKLVIKTTPGYYYSASNTKEENSFFKKTLQEIQFERQKRLLISLLHLYSIKGTKECIEKIVSLLGAPEGLLTIMEYAFQVDNLDSFGIPTNTFEGDRIIDNEKVHIPEFKFEVDVEKLIDKENINNPVNKPLVYKKVYNNDYTYNLREISLNTEPNNAIQNHIVNNFGQEKYNYIECGDGGFYNLQKVDNYLLPLTIPDKYYGFSVEYNIPKGSYSLFNNKINDEHSINFLNLYEVANVNLNVFSQINSLVIDETNTSITIKTINPNLFNEGDVIYVINNKGVNNFNKSHIVDSVVDSNTFIINGNFTLDGSPLVYGLATKQGVHKLNLGSDQEFTYPVPFNYNNRNKNSDGTVNDFYTNPMSDFSILQQKYPTSNFIIDKQYIMSKIEGHDLIFRIRLRNENNGSFEERTAIALNLFDDDGLNHLVRFTLNEYGIEIYKDYEYHSIIPYYNYNKHAITPLNAYAISKLEINEMIYKTQNCIDNYIDPLAKLFFAPGTNLGLDTLKWWDMFFGLPENFDILYKKINVFENVNINDYNIGDKITNELSYTSELYLFEVTGNIKNESQTVEDFAIPAMFYEKNINNIIDFYGYQLPKEVDEFNREVINELQLIPKNISLNPINKNLKYESRIQGFFNSKDIFKFNAWFEEIHNSYEYRLFNGDLFKLYEIYASQVLTLNGLEEFMNFISNKFKNVIKKFIPIVINLSNFDKLFANSEFQMPKMRYNNKFCQGINYQKYGIFTSKVFKDDESENLIEQGQQLFLNIMHNSTSLISVVVPWTVNKNNTIKGLVDELEAELTSLGIDSSVDLFYGQFRISINKENFYSVYGLDLNNVFININDEIIEKLTISTFEIENIIPETINNCGLVINKEKKVSEECGYFNYTLPSVTKKVVYVYYKSENEKDPYIYYKSENNTDKSNVYFKSE